MSAQVVSRDCLAAPGVHVSDQTVVHKPAAKTCYKCQQEGHIARDCPQNAEAEYAD
ncbi:hypothetical protein SISNIDRAFT_487527 [Sistotremastrum niveocremeum HHB9708]|uniref:CCHC-type domain-containing protein n=1 Tax=Sistotremastrum niveocremeum HHB9708 TaxID=1314777 RepID=A0A164S6C0_9AGAM|nr:hypothetical protein SISNIDRAFT_487527 [Sistotremastrum niveocremeum HHB9708]